MLFCQVVFSFADKAGRPIWGEEVSVDQPEKTGVVVLTGGRNRIAMALRLLSLGVGERLLISGVKEGTGIDLIASREDIVLEDGLAVDLGYQAVDTVGNAVEVKAWAHKHKMDKLAVVTSFYHIPRASFELFHAMPEKILVFYAVQSPFVLRQWWRSLGSFLFLATEYTKFLAVYAQYNILGL